MIWVIGDIHGMYDPLKALVTRIEKKEFILKKAYENFIENKKNENDFIHGIEPTPIKLIFIGDYIDFGPSSKEVLDYIMSLKHEKVFLLGNHEDMLLQFKENVPLSSEIGLMWFKNGGTRTLDSFDDRREMFNLYSKRKNTISGDCDFKSADIDIDEKYWDFFYNLKVTHFEEIDLGEKIIRFYFTHGGLYVPDKYAIMKNFSETEEAMNKILEDNINRQLRISTYYDYLRYLFNEGMFFDNTLLWQRKEHTEKYGDFILIHGHTPTYLLPDYFENIGNFGNQAGKYENLPYFMFEKKNVIISEKDYYYNDSRYVYNCSMDKLIEINIDTGCVYGKRLTALGLTKEMLKMNKFEIIQVDLSKSHRLDENVIDSFGIEVNENNIDN